MAAGFNKSSRSRKIDGNGPRAKELPPVTTGRAGMKKVGAAPSMTVGKKGGGKGMKGC